MWAYWVLETPSTPARLELVLMRSVWDLREEFLESWGSSLLSKDSGRQAAREGRPRKDRHEVRASGG